MEELRQRDANLTALQAIGQRKKPRLDTDAATTTTVSKILFSASVCFSTNLPKLTRKNPSPKSSLEPPDWAQRGSQARRWGLESSGWTCATCSSTWSRSGKRAGIRCCTRRISSDWSCWFALPPCVQVLLLPQSRALFWPVGWHWSKNRTRKGLDANSKVSK